MSNKAMLLVDIFRDAGDDEDRAEALDEPEPSNASLNLWAQHAYTQQAPADDSLAVEQRSVSIAIVEPQAIRELNLRYRERDRATNVLAFPASFDPSEQAFAAALSDTPLPIGDIILCAEVIAEEASTQGKVLQDHWAHMVIHGMLHLLGFDHIEAHDAIEMEAREIALLKALEIANPYE